MQGAVFGSSGWRGEVRVHHGDGDTFFVLECVIRQELHGRQEFSAEDNTRTLCIKLARRVVNCRSCQTTLT